MLTETKFLSVAFFSKILKILRRILSLTKDLKCFSQTNLQQVSLKILLKRYPFLGKDLNSVDNSYIKENI